MLAATFAINKLDAVELAEALGKRPLVFHRDQGIPFSVDPLDN